MQLNYRSRRSLFLSLLLGALLGFGLGWVTASYTLQLPSTSMSDSEARAALNRWEIDSAGQQADDGAKALSELRKRMGKAYDMLSAREQAAPYSQLFWKYFAEGLYDKAFEVGTHADAIQQRDTDFVIIYVAALAGRKDWLIKLEQTLSKERDGRRPFVRASLAWERKEWQEVVDLATQSGGAEFPPLAVGNAEDAWFVLMKARALECLGNNQGAFDSYSKVMGRLAGGPVQLHVWTLATQAARKVGDSASELFLIAGYLRVSKAFQADVSFAQERRRMLERAADLRGQMNREQLHKVEEQIRQTFGE